MLTKLESRIVWDGGKIGRGDVVKFPYRTHHNWRPFKIITYDICGVVDTVEDEWLNVLVSVIDAPMNKLCIHVGRADEVTVLWRQNDEE